MGIEGSLWPLESREGYLHIQPTVAEKIPETAPWVAGFGLARATIALVKGSYTKAVLLFSLYPTAYLSGVISSLVSSYSKTC